MKSILISASVVAVSCFATASVAQSTNLQERHLTVARGMCEYSVKALSKWASTAEPNAAYALPVDPKAKKDDCSGENRRSVMAGIAEGAATRKDAERAAIQMCNELKPEDLGNCVVVAVVQ